MDLRQGSKKTNNKTNKKKKVKPFFKMWAATFIFIKNNAMVCQNEVFGFLKNKEAKQLNLPLQSAPNVALSKHTCNWPKLMCPCSLIYCFVFFFCFCFLKNVKSEMLSGEMRLTA